MRCKNAGGGPRDKRPPPSPRGSKGKSVKMISSKRKRTLSDRDTEMARAVAAAAERAEAGGSAGSLCILE